MEEEVLKFSAPFRLSLAGGGTDLPEKYLKSGARLLSVSLDERVNVRIGRHIEHQPSPLTDLFKNYHKEYNVQIFSKIGAGSGLGGSGSLAVSLVAADNYLNNGEIGPAFDIGIEAYRWEREILLQTVGFQDQLIAAIGGCVIMTAEPSGEIIACRRDDLLAGLNYFMENNFIMVESGIQRSANKILKQLALSYFKENSPGPATVEDIESVILNKDGKKFGLLLQNHWNAKRMRFPESTTQEIDYIINTAMMAGANGGKTIGAGGGGYILICSEKENKSSVMKKLESIGCKTAQFSISVQGVRKDE